MAVVATGLIKTEYTESRTLREAMLRSRFADTITKAKVANLVARGVDPLEIEREKERLRSQLKAAAQFYQQREASRLALRAVEESVSIEDNFQAYEELEHLCGCEFIMGNSSLPNLGIGLVLKKDTEDLEEVEKRKMELRKRREAARNALHQMEASVDKEENVDYERELNKLCGYNNGFKWICNGYPLLGIDLVLKKQFCGGDDGDEEVAEYKPEEGEIME